MHHIRSTEESLKHQASKNLKKVKDYENEHEYKRVPVLRGYKYVRIK